MFFLYDLIIWEAFALSPQRGFKTLTNIVNSTKLTKRKTLNPNVPSNFSFCCWAINFCCFVLFKLCSHSLSIPGHAIQEGNDKLLFTFNIIMEFHKNVNICGNVMFCVINWVTLLWWYLWSKNLYLYNDKTSPKHLTGIANYEPKIFFFKNKVQSLNTDAK